MRAIEISTEVFSRIWGQRIEGEETEDAILRRLLGVAETKSATAHSLKTTISPAQRHVWRHDVRSALDDLGGTAHLKDIYAAVRDIRRKNGRSVPANLEAIVRKELEHNSSDALAFQGQRDWFRSTNGIGSGVWSLRTETQQP